jgi:hypothetical protein
MTERTKVGITSEHERVPSGLVLICSGNGCILIYQKCFFQGRRDFRISDLLVNRDDGCVETRQLA